MPPFSWLAAVLALSTRPTSKAPTQRATRTSPVSRSTCTSQKWAPDAARTQRRWSRSVWAMNRTCPAMARTPESAPTETSTWSCPVRTPGRRRGARRPGRPSAPDPPADLWSPRSAMLAGHARRLRRPTGIRARSAGRCRRTRRARRRTGRPARPRRPGPAPWRCPCPSRGTRSAAGRCRRRRARSVRFADEDPGRVVRQGHAVPDRRRSAEPVCVGRLSCQPNSRAPEVHDLADPAVRERPAVHRRDVRLVAQPQVDGVDAEVDGELVHRRLHGERAHGLTGRPHGGVGDEVELDDRRARSAMAGAS